MSKKEGEMLKMHNNCYGPGFYKKHGTGHRKDWFTPKTWTQKPWSIDLDEDNGVYSIYIELPGVYKEDIKIKASSDYIKVKAERKDETSDSEEDKETIFRKKFYFRKHIDCQKISAKFVNGLLSLEIPLKEPPEFFDVNVE
ncbi:MAG: Hsp20/alpha crystallin family protein [Candidatus Hodarchaeales archaeon]